MTPPPRPQWVDFYPEIGQAGGLRKAMQVALDAAGFKLVAGPTDVPSSWEFAAKIGDETRYVSVHASNQERLFFVTFHERSVHMAKGNTSDLAAVVGAIGVWQAGSRLAELRTQWPFVTYGELAEAHERGDAVPVTWKIYREAVVFYIDNALIEAAYEQPRLRALFPFFSHELLHFSRCTRIPYTRDLPFITPKRDGTYLVIWPDGALLERVDTAHEAAMVLIAHMPDDYGPAIDATGHELRSA
jgi:hypothetical protein